MLIYESPDREITIAFSPEVLSHFEQHRQVNATDPESGGQLFARFQGSTAYLEEATGPRPSDRRSRFGFRPNRKAEQKEIQESFERGLHYIGDWHTHPTGIPRPSTTDLASIRASVKRSKHELRGFLLVIVGNEPFPDGLFVSFETGEINQHVNLDATRCSNPSFQGSTQKGS